MNLCESQTKINLMRAFAGECQAQNRYNIAADIAKQQKLIVIERMFKLTANQEEQHAKLFFQLLQECAGENIDIAAGFPADVFTDIGQLLDASAKGENDEAEDIYPAFAGIAQSEGLLRPAEIFRYVAEIEATHRQRFEYYAQLWRDGMLFRSDSTEQQWMCLNCGHIHTGSEPPLNCPVCGVEQGYFIRREEAAFTV